MTIAFPDSFLRKKDSASKTRARPVLELPGPRSLPAPWPGPLSHADSSQGCGERPEAPAQGLFQLWLPAQLLSGWAGH